METDIDQELNDERTQLQEDEEKLQSALQEYDMEWDYPEDEDDEDDEEFLIDLERESSDGTGLAESMSVSSSAGSGSRQQIERQRSSLLKEDENSGTGQTVVSDLISSAYQCEDDDKITSLTADPEKALAMNRALQGILEENIEAIEDAINANKVKQEKLEGDVSSTISRELKKAEGPFRAPYFRAGFEYPESNVDVQAKTRMGYASACGPGLPEKGIVFFHKQTKLRLRNCVIQDCIEKKLRPLMSRMEAEIDRMSSATESLEMKESQILKERFNLVDEEDEDKRSAAFEYISKLHAELETIKHKIKGHSENLARLEDEITDVKDHPNEEELIRNVDTEKVDWMKICRQSFADIVTWVDCKKAWEHSVNPAVNDAPFTTDEKNRLKKIVESELSETTADLCIDWEDVAQKLGTRHTAFQCFGVYQRYFNKTLRNRPWTKEEDEHLMESANKVKMRVGFYHWRNVSILVENRSPQDCLRRFLIIDPFHQKGHFTPEEDARLLAAIEIFGECWNKIARFVGSRTSVQVRERYEISLNPELNFTKFTYEEDMKLLKLYKEKGKAWTEMTEHFVGRPGARLASRYKQLLGWRKKKDWFESQPVDVQRLLIGKNLPMPERRKREELVHKYFTEQLAIKLDDYKRQKLDERNGVDPDVIPYRPPLFMRSAKRHNGKGLTMDHQFASRWAKKIAIHHQLQENLKRLLKQYLENEAKDRENNPDRVIPKVVQEEQEENLINQAVSETLKNHQGVQVPKSMLKKMQELLSKSFVDHAQVHVSQILKAATEKPKEFFEHRNKHAIMDAALKRQVNSWNRYNYRPGRHRKFFEQDGRPTTVLEREEQEKKLTAPRLYIESLGSSTLELYEQARRQHIALQDSLENFPNPLDDPEFMAQEAKLEQSIEGYELNKHLSKRTIKRQEQLILQKHRRLEEMFKRKYSLEKSRMQNEVHMLQQEDIKNLHELLKNTSDVPESVLEQCQPVWWPNRRSDDIKQSTSDTNIESAICNDNAEQRCQIVVTASAGLIESQKDKEPVLGDTEEKIDIPSTPNGSFAVVKEELPSPIASPASKNCPPAADVPAGPVMSAARKSRRTRKLAPSAPIMKFCETLPANSQKEKHFKAQLKRLHLDSPKIESQVKEEDDDMKTHFLNKTQMEEERRRIDRISEYIAPTWAMSATPTSVPRLACIPPCVTTLQTLKRLLLKRAQFVKRSASLSKPVDLSIMREKYKKASGIDQDIILLDSSGKELKAEEWAAFVEEEPEESVEPPALQPPTTSTSEESLVSNPIHSTDDDYDPDMLRTKALDSFIKRANRWVPRNGSQVAQKRFKTLRTFEDIVASNPEYNVANFSFKRKEKKSEQEPPSASGSAGQKVQVTNQREEKCEIQEPKLNKDRNFKESGYEVVISNAAYYHSIMDYHRTQSNKSPGPDEERNEETREPENGVDTSVTTDNISNSPKLKFKRVGKTYVDCIKTKLDGTQEPLTSVDQNNQKNADEMVNGNHKVIVTIDKDKTNKADGEMEASSKSTTSSNSTIVNGSVSKSSSGASCSSKTSSAISNKQNQTTNSNEMFEFPDLCHLNRETIDLENESESDERQDKHNSEDKGSCVEVLRDKPDVDELEDPKFQKLVERVSKNVRNSGRNAPQVVVVGLQKEKGHVVHYHIDKDKKAGSINVVPKEVRPVRKIEYTTADTVRGRPPIDKNLNIESFNTKFADGSKKSDEQIKKERQEKAQKAERRFLETLTHKERLSREILLKQEAMHSIRQSREYLMLKERIRSLFLWPVLMSTVKPMINPQLHQWLNVKAEPVGYIATGRRKWSRKTHENHAKTVQSRKYERKRNVRRKREREEKKSAMAALAASQSGHNAVHNAGDDANNVNSNAVADGDTSITSNTETTEQPNVGYKRKADDPGTEKKTKKKRYSDIPKKVLPRREASMNGQAWRYCPPTATPSTSGTSIQEDDMSGNQGGKKKHGNTKEVKPKPICLRKGRKRVRHTYRPSKVVPERLPQWWKEAVLAGIVAKHQKEAMGGESDGIVNIEEDDDFVDRGNYSDDDWLQELRMEEEQKAAAAAREVAGGKENSVDLSIDGGTDVGVLNGGGPVVGVLNGRENEVAVLKEENDGSVLNAGVYNVAVLNGGGNVVGVLNGRENKVAVLKEENDGSVLNAGVYNVAVLNGGGPVVGVLNGRENEVAVLKEENDVGEVYNVAVLNDGLTETVVKTEGRPTM